MHDRNESRLSVRFRQNTHKPPGPAIWHLAEWPRGVAQPTKYWVSTLPRATSLRRLVTAAKQRWRVEQELRADEKPNLGLTGRVTAYRSPAHVLFVIEDEAKIVHRIFDEFGSGRPPKAIARDLNRDRVRPPRGPRAQGWTWTALVGNLRLGTGILNNTLYIGQHTWNRCRWEKDPETGKRVPRFRPRDDWTIVERPELRIIPQELWERAKARQTASVRPSAISSRHAGRGPKYLLSGLLACGVCGGRYIVYNSTYYACSFHTNRGDVICPNGKVVRRSRVEAQVLHVIRQEVFTPDALAYLTDRVHTALARLTRAAQTRQHNRHTVEQALAQVLQERAHVKDAIRRGLAGEITREMLDEIEARIRILRSQLEVAPSVDRNAASVLPRAIETRLQLLDKVLGRDVERARCLLRELLGEIVLRPTSQGVVAELRGNVEGLLVLEGALPAELTGNCGSGGPLLSIPVERVLVAY